MLSIQEMQDHVGKVNSALADPNSTEEWIGWEENGQQYGVNVGLIRRRKAEMDAIREIS